MLICDSIMSLIDSIRQLAKQNEGEVISVRRHIHQNPELSFEEFETQKFLKAKLHEIGIDAKPIGNTGLVALIEGNHPNKSGGKVVALRADMDALPILEETDIPFKSKKDGVMHACGHDVHSSCLFGAAKILQETRNEWNGTVKLIFQPGEEKLPGGASILIKEGVLTHPKPDAIIGQHVMPWIKTGAFGFRKGLYMASTDEIYITIKGKGSHGAMPQYSIDPIATAAQVITALQQVISRKATPTIPSVLTIGKINSDGGATNIIPQSVKMEGTFRTLDEDWRAEAHKHIKLITEQTAAAFGAIAEVDIRKGYPFLMNDEGVTELCQNAAKQYVGEDKVEELDMYLAAEDFSYYSQEIPATFYRLGIKNDEKETGYAVHHPKFKVDEDALAIGSGMMAWLAVSYLASHNAED
jgi:amidohydrolase